MERLEAKKVSGHTYYYYSKWGWKDGKCRRLWQRYLGKLEDLVKAVDGGPAPMYAEVFESGLPTALWQEVGRQELVGHVDALCPKRAQGLSVGQYVAVAAVNRAIRPKSKRAMWDWFTQTTLRRFLPQTDAPMLSSQRFWDHMDAISTDQAEGIWQRVVTDTLARENVDLSQICYDGTNYYSFISTFNARCSIAKRGKNKQGRSNLRQVSYALFCTRDGHMPVYYDIYEGNRNDAHQFPLMVKRFHEFLAKLDARGRAVQADVTVVFDKGNNSQDNIGLLDQGGLHFVGSVKLDEHKDLAAIPDDDERLAVLDKPSVAGTKALTLRKEIYGKERQVVVMFNPKLFSTQYQTVQNDVAKALDGLGELKQRLEDRAAGLIKGGRAPTVESVSQHCRDLLKRQHLSRLIRWEARPGPVPTLTYQLCAEELQDLCRRCLGKKLLITSRLSWSMETVIEAYHNQYVIEHVFRESKDHERGTWWPMNHWTDQKIHVHGLYCTLALLLRSVMHRRATQGGLSLSMVRLLDELAGIREVVNVRKPKRREKEPRRQTVLTKMNEIQSRLVTVLGLELSSGDASPSS